tara:strand:- start:896 stop:1093 length:198 start_codon:yes stop_codon:yes gene_type:complete
MAIYISSLLLSPSEVGKKTLSLGEDFSLSADLARQKLAKTECRKVLQTYLKNYSFFQGFTLGYLV